MASTLPGKQYLDDLRALRGTPKVSYPYGGTSYPRVERVFSVPKGRVDNIPATLTDYGVTLTSVTELKRDATEVEVYLVYETLPGPPLVGQEFDPVTSLLTSYSEQITAPGVGLGVANSAITPINTQKQSLRTYSPPTEALAAFYRQYPSTDDFVFPNVLQSLEVVWETSTGNGEYTEEGSGESAGDNAHLSLSLNGTGEGSGSIMPALIPIYQEIWAREKPTMEYYFFLPNPCTHAQILTKLTALAGASVSAWPTFRPLGRTFVLRGQKISLTAKAAAACSASIGSGDYSWCVTEGHGSGQDISSTIRTENLPPMLNGAITITGATPPTISPSASASAVVTSGTNFPGASASESAFSGSGVQGSISPTSISATSGYSAIPSSGLFAYGFRTDNFQWGHVVVRARVFNFADL